MSEGEDLRKLSGTQKALAVAKRREDISTLIARGRTLREAAEALGLTFGQAAAAYRGVLREVERTIIRNTDTARARALTKVLRLQRETWEAYERAKRGAVAQDAVLGADGQTLPGTAGRVRRTTALHNEARLLETMRRLYADERKLLGLESKEKEPEKPPAVNIERGIVIVNEAGLPDNVPWLSTISGGIARQGVGVLPAGTTDAEAAVVEAEVAEKRDGD